MNIRKHLCWLLGHRYKVTFKPASINIEFNCIYCGHTNPRGFTILENQIEPIHNVRYDTKEQEQIEQAMQDALEGEAIAQAIQEAKEMEQEAKEAVDQYEQQGGM